MVLVSDVDPSHARSIVMSPIGERWSAVGRWCVAAFIVGAASFVMLLGTLRTERLNVDVGPGDADYAQGLSDFWLSLP